MATFALFVAHRFGFDAGQTGYFFAAFGILGAVVQGVLIRPIVGRLGDKTTFILGLVCSTVGLVAATLTNRRSRFTRLIAIIDGFCGSCRPTVAPGGTFATGLTAGLEPGSFAEVVE